MIGHYCRDSSARFPSPNKAACKTLSCSVQRLNSLYEVHKPDRASSVYAAPVQDKEGGKAG